LGFEADRRGRREQSVLYSHSLNPLWNRSMKWHSPVQKRKVKRQVMREDIAAPISDLTLRGGKLERVKVIFNHTVQHENIISITEHRRSSVMWNDGEGEQITERIWAMIWLIRCNMSGTCSNLC